MKDSLLYIDIQCTMYADKLKKYYVYLKLRNLIQ